MLSGSNGMVLAVLFIVKKSLTWPSRRWAVDLLSAIIKEGNAGETTSLIEVFKKKGKGLLDQLIN